jgi:hypothetical protein
MTPSSTEQPFGIHEIFSKTNMHACRQAAEGFVECPGSLKTERPEAKAQIHGAFYHHTQKNSKSSNNHRFNRQ